MITYLILLLESFQYSKPVIASNIGSLPELVIDGENGSDTHMIPGEGNIPIKEMLYEMKRIGYDKTATLELVTNYINEPRFYAKRAIDNMRELMAEAGIV